MKLLNHLSIITFTLLFIAMSSCKTENKGTPFVGESLPYIGKHTEIDGATQYHRIREFSFIDQDSNVVTNKTLNQNIYISDFFFTSCRTICPKVMKQMSRIHNKYKDDDRVILVSHTIDPKRDTPERLKKYAKALEVDTKKWWFLTGEKDSLLDIADDYFVVAFEDPDSPDGFDHSGKIILVDTKGHVRGFAEGTEEASVDGFFSQVDQLLKEMDEK